MPIHNLFSKRQKELNGDVPDFLVYDDIPEALRVKITYIFQDAIGKIQPHRPHNKTETAPDVIYKRIRDKLCREYGLHCLIEFNPKSYYEEVFYSLTYSTNVEQVIDTIELCCQEIDKEIRKSAAWEVTHFSRNMSPDDALSELNDRFKEHGIGYQYAGGDIIRVDSTVMHAYVTQPTLQLLHNPKFKGAQEEYLKAHEHYLQGENDDCMVDCCKAFESTMKTICTEKSWPYDAQRDTSHRLIGICFANGLVPSHIQSQFTCLQNMLESGVPTIRNRQGGHGQGPTPQPVDGDITRYCLHLTGANIIFLIEKSGIK